MGDVDDDDGVITLQTCSFPNCGQMRGLKLDDETGMPYCEGCLRRIADAEAHGFHLLLSIEDKAIVGLIFAGFDTEKRGFWTFHEFREYCIATNRDDGLSNGSEDLQKFVQDEYGIDLKEDAQHGFVVKVVDLEDIYGGYVYNNQYDVLTEDAECLNDQGIIHLGVLE